MRYRHLWVIEQQLDTDPTVWFPMDTGFTRDEARNTMIDMQQDSPKDQFRVREYVPYGDEGTK